MSQFVEYLHEVFGLFGPVEARKMFGGFGIYHDGLMFALVADDTLYLKADAENGRYFAELELEQFEYVKNGKTMKLSYCRAPDVMLEDREEAAIWARRSFETALRAQSLKSKSKKK